VASYSVFIKPSAVRDLKAVPLSDRRRLLAKIQHLASNPRPPGAEKLSGQEKYRLRQGDYRVLFSIDDGQSSVVVVKIAHRREAYR
jgi:mRNA interferase RelE/StbE